MFKRKCPSCAKKVEKKFSYCPWCGVGFKQKREQEDFGMLGRNDSSGKVVNEMKLPFGMNTIVNSLVKQLEKQMGNMEGVDPERMPKGFKIQISSGTPQIRQVVHNEEIPEKENSVSPSISLEERERRAKLPWKDATSKVRRLGDTIIYEIDAPGVKSKKDVTITKLEQGIEVKAYSKDKCYVKVIPLKVEILGYEIRDEKVLVELKG